MKMCALLGLGFATLVGLIGCFEWRYDVIEHGAAFRRVRESGRLTIGELKQDAVIAGRPCRQGWVHLHPGGVPAAFTASREFTAGKLMVPAGTWVFQNAQGIVTVCAFPRNTEVQGHLCRGTSGPKGVQTSFHPDGALKQFFPPRNVRIDGILCHAGFLTGTVELHPNGRLKSAVLAENLVREGRMIHRHGERVTFDAAGGVLPAPAPADGEK